jgi:DNA-binding IclR family transcriptional regulator
MLIKDRILKLLRLSPQGLTITEVTKILQIHYSTSSRYLAVLEAEGKIIHRDIGMAKLFVVKK